jgi:glucose dehydrogenase
VHHDIWDYHAASPVVLFDIAINGQPRKGIAEADRTGWVYILDRTNGKPLIGIEERPVPQGPRQKTAKTQPFPANIPPGQYTTGLRYTNGTQAPPIGSPLGGTFTAIDSTTNKIVRQHKLPYRWAVTAVRL